MIFSARVFPDIAVRVNLQQAGLEIWAVARVVESEFWVVGLAVAGGFVYTTSYAWLFFIRQMIGCGEMWNI